MGTMAFDHLQGYSAIYYTYKWSEVIAKDMFTKFDENNMLDPVQGKRFRDLVLAPGGTKPAAQLVREFLGRDYTADAFNCDFNGNCEEEQYFAGALGESCPEGHNIVSETECVKALEALDLKVAPMWTGAYRPVPYGCSWREGGAYHGHFNTEVMGAAHKDRKPVCNTKKSPYYLADAGSLCPTAEQVSTQEECTHALKTLQLSTKSMWTGSYQAIPSGCSFRAGWKYQGHFNAHNKGRASAERQPVCKRM